MGLLNLAGARGIMIQRKSRSGRLRMRRGRYAGGPRARGENSGISNGPPLPSKSRQLTGKVYPMPRGDFLMRSGRRSRERASIVGWVVFFGSAALVPIASADDPVAAPAPAPTAWAMGVEAGELFHPDIPAADEADVQIRIPLDGATVTLQLEPRSVRGAGYQLLSQNADGSFDTLDPGPVRTYRGTVAEHADSGVAASLLDDGLYARIRLADGSVYWVEPLAKQLPTAAPGEHILYRQQDVVPSHGTCEVFGEGAAAQESAEHDPPATGGTAGGAFYYTELVCEADFEYFQDWGSVSATQSQIENIINVMNGQYEEELAITHIITAVVVRSAEPDPYTSNVTDTMLNQFRAVWLNANPPADVNHDVAHLFTGKNIVGTDGSSGVIGVAWLNGICNGLGYGVVENCCSALACRTDLSAHELGHNWSAQHCSCPTYTMNPSLTCVNQFGPAPPQPPNDTIDQITNYRDTRTCIQFDDPLLRILIGGPTSVPEGTSVQYTATADYMVGPDVDVTHQAVWSVEPPSMGAITPNGLFTATNVGIDTPATIRATFTDDTGSDADLRPITIVNTDTPDPRRVAVGFSAEVDPATLCIGQSFSADVLMSSTGGAIEQVRLLQLDPTASVGFVVNELTWDLASLADDSLYLVYNTDSIFSATYVATSGIPGTILTLTSVPQVVAHVTATVTAEGALDLCGPINPPSVDVGVRVLAGFNQIAEFSRGFVNVDCGMLETGASPVPAEILSSMPPAESIDARQPSDLSGDVPAGWDSIELLWTCPLANMAPSDFELILDPLGEAPTVAAVSQFGTTSTLELDRPIPPGHWTTITHLPTGQSVRLGSLPGDVNGDLASNPIDILRLIDHLNGMIQPPYPEWQTDINRSGVTEPSDVLRVIDLLNGANAFDVWNGATLP